MKEIQYKKQARHGKKILISHIQYGIHLIRGTGQKQHQNPAPKQYHNDRNGTGNGNTDPEGRIHPYPDPLNLSRTDILPGKGGHGIAERGGRQLQQPIQLIGGEKSGDIHRAIAVDDILHYHAAYADNGILERHGGTDFDQRACHFSARFPVMRFQEKNWNPPDNFHTIKTRKQLTQHRCRGSTGNSPMKGRDKHDVQDNVDHGSQYHGNQRRLAVAQRP